jgi:hypothetical protein
MTNCHFAPRTKRIPTELQIITFLTRFKSVCVCVWRPRVKSVVKLSVKSVSRCSLGRRLLTYTHTHTQFSLQNRTGTIHSCWTDSVRMSAYLPCSCVTLIHWAGFTFRISWTPVILTSQLRLCRVVGRIGTWSGWGDENWQRKQKYYEKSCHCLHHKFHMT